MKNTLTRTLIVAAVAVASTAVAFGQDGLNASIPFAFSVGNLQMAAGNYSIDNRVATGDPKVFKLSSTATKKAVASAAMAPIYNNNDPRPRLVFLCESSGCQLKEAWLGPVGYEWNTKRPNMAEDEERIAVVYLTKSTSGD